MQNIDDGLRVELSAFLQIPLEEIVNGGPISPHASLMLDIVESMWYEQSLKERQYDAWISLLKMDQLPKVRWMLLHMRVVNAYVFFSLLG